MKIKKEIIYGCESRGDYDKPYLIRYTLLKTVFLKICLHIFVRSDHDDLHDHPWPFLSVILWRGYIEQTLSNKSRKWPLMVLYRPALHLHRVQLVDDKKAVTLVFMGKRTRNWGFLTKKGWVDWVSYFKKMGC